MSRYSRLVLRYHEEFPSSRLPYVVLLHHPSRHASRTEAFNPEGDPISWAPRQILVMLSPKYIRSYRSGTHRYFLAASAGAQSPCQLDICIHASRVVTTLKADCTSGKFTASTEIKMPEGFLKRTHQCGPGILRRAGHAGICYQRICRAR